MKSVERKALLSDRQDDAVYITADVQLPAAVLDAHRAGRLVFFVGAGASVAEPSGLPLFGQLAEELANLARFRHPARGEQLDLFLGSMPLDFETHVHAHRIISRPDSAPNATHNALVRLASALGPTRIVTTNFDDHLARTAAESRIPISDVWIGPALPIGDEFEGLVHLHGSVRRGPTELVLTDRDFGHAYLTRGWATRFLLSMFQRFTVVFVGYSHDDPLMRYLALGLPADTPRFAFTASDTAGDEKWKRLNVHAISYPAPEGDHGALVRALNEWDARTRMGHYEHRSRMRDIVGAGTTMVPVDRDYVRSRVGAPDGVRDFDAAVAELGVDEQVQWLRWLEGVEDFAGLFAGREASEAAAMLGRWFCRTFIASPERHGAALQTVLRLGHSFTPGLFNDACWAAEELSRTDADAGRRWLVFLATSIRGHSAPVDAGTLLDYEPGPEVVSLPIARAMLRPLLVLKPRWFLGDGDSAMSAPNADIGWAADEHALSSRMGALVEAYPRGHRALGNVLEDAVESAYDLLSAYHGETSWDGLSSRRSAIEPHQQDAMRDPIDAVIDALRAYGVRAVEVIPDLAERWWEAAKPLFRRLSMHLLAQDPSRSADEKITWVLDRRALYSFEVKHETFQVLRSAVAAAGAESRRELLAAVQAGPDVPDTSSQRDRYLTYAIYNLLVWLTSAAPEWTEAVEALRDIQERHSFAPREHPDFDSWLSTAEWDGPPAHAVDDFVERVANDPGSALEVIIEDLEEQGAQDWMWSTSLSVTSQAAEARPEYGLLLWSAIEQHTSLSAQQSAVIRSAIVEGWSKVELGELAADVATVVLPQTIHPECAPAIGRFLVEQVGRRMESDDDPFVATLRRTAERLWAEQESVFEHSPDADLAGFAPLFLNSWPGAVARYWLREIDRRWRHNRDDWTGLNEEERQALSDLLAGQRQALDATQPALANELFFLYAADPEFTETRILPLFNGDLTATLAWSAYLHHPRYNDAVLAAGLLESTIAQWNRLTEITDHSVRQNFLGLTASILSVGSIPSESRQRLLDRTVLAADGVFAASFAEAVGTLVANESVDGGQLWTQWIRGHVQDRLLGIPRVASREELARWSDLVPSLGDEVTDAASVLSGRGIGLGDGYFRMELSGDALSNHADVVVDYLADRLRNTQSHDQMVAYRVRKLISTVSAAVGREVAEPLIRAALEQNLLGASDTSEL